MNFILFISNNFRFFHLNPEVVLGRLVFRKHYGVAIQISKYLNLPESWIFEHWAYHEAIKDPSMMDSLFHTIY